MQVGDLVIVTCGERPQYGEFGQVVEVDRIGCFITVQFGDNPLNFDVYFSDELLVISPSTTSSVSAAEITVSDPEGETTVN